MRKTKHQKPKINDLTRGFTLVETLVAIAILMIAIAGPLVIASKGLTAALYARDQMAASYLAQESMEVVKNKRDNNLNNALTWDDGFSGCVRLDVSDTNACDASGFLAGAVPGIYSTGQTEYTLYSYGTYLSPQPNSSPSNFSRYFFLNPLSSVGHQEYLVTVVVKWKQGVIDNELRLSSTLTDGLR